MAKKGSTDIISVFTALLVIGVIIVGGIFLYRLTNGFNEEVKTFYVIIDEQKVTTVAKGYTVKPEDELCVKVRYTFGNPKDVEKLYSIKVTSNCDQEHAFDYVIGDEVYSYTTDEDYTDGFDIEYYDDYFILRPKGRLEDILNAVYGDVSECEHKEFDDMFLLTVYSYNGQSSVSVYFTIGHSVTGVELDQREVFV